VPSKKHVNFFASVRNLIKFCDTSAVFNENKTNGAKIRTNCAA
jgi:hypothetical protein